jgi:hypothetical protein
MYKVRKARRHRRDAGIEAQVGRTTEILCSVDRIVTVAWARA